MVRRYDAGRRLFLRYALNNVLILVLPMLMAALASRMSFRVILSSLDATAASSLEAGAGQIDRMLAELPKMYIQVANDYEVGYYLSAAAPLSGVEFYNLKRVQSKLSSFVLGNGILSHCLLYMAKSGFVVTDEGFAPYGDFYGTLFSCGDVPAERWLAEVLRSPDGERFERSDPVRMGGPPAAAALYRRPIGHGDYYLGTVVGILDAAAMARLLTDLPDRYGGRVEVRDAAGGLVCATGPESGADGADRLYTARSALAGWTYTARLSGSRVLAKARAVRDLAFLLLGLGLAAGLGASYLFAASNARPLQRLFRLVLPEGAAEDRDAGVSERLERAVERMRRDAARLEREAASARRLITGSFFQTLLRGGYSDREGFEEERRSLGIGFPAGPCWAAVCRLPPLHAVPEGEPHAVLRDALLEAADRRLREGEHAAPVSFDDVLLVKGLEEGRPFREQALAFLEGLRADLPPAVRGGFLFGVGSPTPDPFLLMVSHAEAALAASAAAQREHPIRFYADVPQGRGSYFYPLTVEEGIMKAVRSANRDLLDSLLSRVREENFAARRLAAVEARNLFIEMQGTALRLADDLPAEDPAFRGALAQWSERPPSPAALEGLSEILRGLMGAFDSGKKSHNAKLLASLQAYVAEHFAEPDLGLSRIADAFDISENYLSSFHKEQTGEGLLAAIQRIRFDEAERLLASGGLGVDAVARRCGYANTTSFRRAFKRHLGLSPSEFRARAVRKAGA